MNACVCVIFAAIDGNCFNNAKKNLWSHYGVASKYQKTNVAWNRYGFVGFRYKPEVKSLLYSDVLSVHWYKFENTLAEVRPISTKNSSFLLNLDELNAYRVYAKEVCQCVYLVHTQAHSCFQYLCACVCEQYQESKGMKLNTTKSKVRVSCSSLTHTQMQYQPKTVFC